MNTFCSMLGTPMETGRNSPTRENETLIKPESPNTEDLNVETQEKGTVKFAIYKKYWRAVGFFLSPTILLSLLAMQITRNLTDVWLAHWVSLDESNSTSPNISSFATQFPHRQWKDDSEASSPWQGDRKLGEADLNIKYYLSVYATIAASNSFFSLIRAFLFAYGGICAAKSIHGKLLRKINKKFDKKSVFMIHIMI